MMELYGYIKDNVVYLLSLWANEKIANEIGANFLYLMLAIWLTWLVVNTYVIRPINGSLFGGLVSSANREERKSYESFEKRKERNDGYSERYKKAHAVPIRHSRYENING